MLLEFSNNTKILIPANTLDTIELVIRNSVRAELDIFADKFLTDSRENILTSSEMISLLKISKSFLVKLRSKGLPFYQLEGGVIRYNRLEVLEYMRSLKKTKP